MSAAVRTCRSCGQRLVQRAEESVAEYRSRRICSTRTCTGRGGLTPSFPGAIEAAALPAACDRCGAPWRVTEDGVTCLICARHRVVREALVALARRGGPIAAHADVPMGTRIHHPGAAKSAAR